MNKQFITKISVLIDKISYINNNNDFNSLITNDIDLKLLKNYSKELYELLNSIPSTKNKKIEDQTTIIKKIETKTPENTKPVVKPEIKETIIDNKQDEEIINETATNEPNEALNMKPISDNIFDTVNNIKQKSKISRLNRLQFTENEAIEDETEEEKTVEENKEEPLIENKEAQHLENIALQPDNSAIKNTEIVPTFLREKVTAKIEERETTKEEDKEEEENQSLNDRFKQGSASVADKVTNTGFKNLKELIDINDRFLFIQKLFGGSYLAFEESVNQINNINTYSEALDYIDYKIKSNFDWDNNNEEVARFLNILEKKYN